MKKTVLITGSSRGIGRATAEIFAMNQYQVMIHYHHLEEEAVLLKTILNLQGCTAEVYKADVRDHDQVEQMVQQGISKFGTIDVLVNNVGISKQSLFTDISEADWDEMMNVNVKGVFNCCQCILPGMIHRKEGKIINISSIWGMTGSSCEVHYSTAKAAIIGLTKALAKEVGPSNIQVNCVAPGIINTDMNSSIDEETIKCLIDSTPLQRLGDAQDIGNCILFLASDKSNFITGQVISPNGGILI